MSRKQRRLWWDFVALIGFAGIIYGAIEYIEAAGAWKALVMIPLMLVLGYMAVEILYPLWFREQSESSKWWQIPPGKIETSSMISRIKSHSKDPDRVS